MKILFYLFLTTTGAFVTTCSLAQAEIFLKASDNANNPIDGGSQVRDHEGAIEVLAFSESDAACGFNASPGDRSCGGVTGPWHFTMRSNKAIIPLKNAMYSGKTLDHVDISVVKPGTTFIAYKVHMEAVFVTTISESAAGGGGGLLSFFIGLDPTRIKWTQVSQKADGSAGEQMSFGWDREKGKSF